MNPIVIGFWLDLEKYGEELDKDGKEYVKAKMAFIDAIFPFKSKFRI